MLSVLIIFKKLHTTTDKRVCETVSYIGAGFRRHKIVQDMYALYCFNEYINNAIDASNVG